MKKIFVLISAVTAMLLLSVTAFADYNYTEFIDKQIASSQGSYSPVASQNIIMMSLDDKQTILYEKNADERKDPASLSKILVGILSINECPDLNQIVTVPQSAVDAVLGTGWGVMNLFSGEEVTVRDLVYCTLMANANDTCFALVDTILGGKENCVRMMNEYVASLDCENTNFTNPNGTTDANQYTTPREMMKIYSECLANSTFREIMGTTAYYMEPTNYYNGKRLATATYLSLSYSGYHNEYTNGGRYAGTSADTCNVVCSSSHDGYNYIICALDSPVITKDGDTNKTALSDANTLFSWVHKNIKLKTVATTDSYCGEAAVKYSSKYDYVSLSPEKDITILVPDNTTTDSIIFEINKSTLPESLTGSVKKGDYVCNAYIKYSDMIIGEIPLVAGFDITMNPVKIITSGIGNFVSTSVFRGIVYVIIFLVFLIGLVIGIKRKSKKQNEFRKSRSGGSSYYE